MVDFSDHDVHPDKTVLAAFTLKHQVTHDLTINFPQTY